LLVVNLPNQLPITAAPPSRSQKRRFSAAGLGREANSRLGPHGAPVAQQDGNASKNGGV